MISDRQALVAIASRIADAENRVAQLRWRVERLRARAATRRRRLKPCRLSRATLPISMCSNQ